MYGHETEIQNEAIRERDSKINELRRDRNEWEAKANQYTRLLAIAVQRLGGQMVIVDDELPTLKICGNVVTTRPVVREYPVVTGRDLGRSDE